jgi:hypothetical protein
MAAFKVYEANAVDVVMIGIPITDGKGDPFVKIAPRGDAYEDDMGVDGEVCRYGTNEYRYDIEVTLKGFSSHNEQLAAILAADRESTSGFGVGVLLVKDNNGAAIFAADKLWCKGLPEQSFGKNKPDVTWKFTAVAKNFAMIVGGN